MPTPLNLRIPDIPGSSEKEGREGTIDVFEVEHSVIQPINAATGMGTGTRVHAPLTVLANIDKATPALLKALCTGRVLDEVILEYYRIDPETRSETKYYEITMRRVRVVVIRPYVPNTLKPENEALRHMVLYGFAYEEIEWKFIPDSMVETDTWQAPKESGSASK